MILAFRRGQLKPTDQLYDIEVSPEGVSRIKYGSLTALLLPGRRDVPLGPVNVGNSRSETGVVVNVVSIKFTQIKSLGVLDAKASGFPSSIVLKTQLCDRFKISENEEVTLVLFTYQE